MSKHNHPIIIKKRKHKGHEGGHGAWKIAYADFMTAMMAFFLVMWLIAMSTPKELVQIADYFKMPLKIALTGGPRSSDSESTIPGGGDDPTHEKGEVHKTLDAETIKRRMEAMRLNRLRESLDQMIESEPRLKALRAHLIINMVQEGLRIQIIDSQNRPMFKTGSSDVEPYMRDILRSIAPILNDMPNKISLAGHTDDIPYIGGERGYSNWELSTDRANASRRELVSGGLASGKVLRVVGMADMMKLKNRGADDAINRRISLLVLNHETEEQIEKENAESYSEQVTEPEGVKQLVSPAQPAPPVAAAPVIKSAPSAPVAQPAPSASVAPVAQPAPSAPVAPVAQPATSAPAAPEAPSAQTVAPVTPAPNEQPVSPVNTKPSPDLQLSTPVDGHPADPVTTLPTAADGGSQVNHDSQQR